MKKIYIISTISIIFITFCVLNKYSNPILMTKAKNESYNIMTRIVNEAVSKTIIDSYDVNDLFILSYDTNGNIVSIDLDSMIINKILAEISLNIEKKLRNIEITNYQIPFGIVFKNNFLAHLGPNIPVKMKLVGSVINHIETNITNYGINNALVEVFVDIKVNLNIILPFVSDNITTNNRIPLALKLIRGNVPEYYSGNSNGNLISIPIE